MVIPGLQGLRRTLRVVEQGGNLKSIWGFLYYADMYDKNFKEWPVTKKGLQKSSLNNNKFKKK